MKHVQTLVVFFLIGTTLAIASPTESATEAQANVTESPLSASWENSILPIRLLLDPLPDAPLKLERDFIDNGTAVSTSIGQSIQGNEIDEEEVEESPSLPVPQPLVSEKRSGEFFAVLKPGDSPFSFTLPSIPISYQDSQTETFLALSNALLFLGSFMVLKNLPTRIRRREDDQHPFHPPQHRRPFKSPVVTRQPRPLKKRLPYRRHRPFHQKPQKTFRKKVNRFNTNSHHDLNNVRLPHRPLPPPISHEEIEEYDLKYETGIEQTTKIVEQSLSDTFTTTEVPVKIDRLTPTEVPPLRRIPPRIKGRFRRRKVPKRGRRRRISFRASPKNLKTSEFQRRVLNPPRPYSSEVFSSEDYSGFYYEDESPFHNHNMHPEFANDDDDWGYEEYDEDLEDYQDIKKIHNIYHKGKY